MLLLIQLLFALVLIILNGAFALSGLAIVSARKARFKTMADAGRPGARTALALAEEPRRFLSTVQIGITLIDILAGATPRNLVNPQPTTSPASRSSPRNFLPWGVTAWGPVAASLVWLLTAAPAQAQTVIDGSDNSFDPNDRALLLAVLRTRLPDPQSALLRSIVQPKPGVYCGEVATRGRDDESGEFGRFVVETKIRQVTVTPTTDPARIAMILRMIEDRCRS